LPSELASVSASADAAATAFFFFLGAADAGLAITTTRPKLSSQRAPIEQLRVRIRFSIRDGHRVYFMRIMKGSTSRIGLRGF
jgi:hypothetical protein